jgi:hypothetical protein
MFTRWQLYSVTDTVAAALPAFVTAREKNASHLLCMKGNNAGLSTRLTTLAP